ncbi:UNVERIFIED_CONTAM: Carbon catabolite repressor protein 45 [Sesamum radiatum]|uniref:Carbon catabolite repressor protein 45 n=1 Tax=Sesamum radiatum TaxID=300843 RepID=A0AAW2WJJ1_SESRA
MERSGDNRTVPTEHSSPPPPNSSGRRLHRQERQRSRKKRKVMSSETETRIQIQTLKPDSALMFSSYTHRRTNSYVRKQGRSRMKPRKPQRQRKWTYSTHDVSNYNGKLKLFFEQLFIVNALFLKFQEVDHFDDLKEILGSDGFRGMHKARSGETRDGCAIFWKTEHPSTSRNFLVGNIHVLYNPKRGDIKLGQLHIQQHDRRHVSGQIFPSEYAESQSRHNRIMRPLMNRWTNEEIMLATGSRHSVLRHHLKLCSAYAGVPVRYSWSFLKPFHGAVCTSAVYASKVSA